MMRKNVLFVILMAVGFVGEICAQELTVKSMVSLPMDISASQYERKDLNGKPCALVKVQFATTGAQFEGNVVGNTDYKTNEYWVYMTEGSYMLSIKHPSFVTLSVNFRDHGINALQSKATYRLTLLMPQMGNMNVDDGMRYLAMTVEPATATVYIDDQPQVLQNGTLSMLLPMGQHSYRVEAPAYESKDSTFTIGSEKLSLSVRLESLMASLGVTATTVGTQIYVNDQLRGTSSWTGSLAAGTYRIEGRLDGYRSHRQTVTLSERDRQAVTIPALEAIVGNLNVNFQPANAEVWLDGKKVGTSPDILRNLAVGSHEVELRASGHQTKKETVTIEEGKTTALNGSLSIIYAEDSEIEGLNAVQLFSLAEEFEKGNNQRQKNKEKALKYYRMSANQGYAKAQNILGLRYGTGDGVTKDYAEAVKWHMKAANQDYAEAQDYLALMYQQGLGVKQDYKEALKWYRKAADQGYASSQEHLAYMYKHGLGVEQNYSEALKLYRMAADQGHVYAQYNLACMYAKGEGVTLDYGEAIKWWLKAASKNDPDAQFNLGISYERGYGVEKNINQAKEWYQKAAGQGHQGAKKKLENLK